MLSKKTKKRLIAFGLLPAALFSVLIILDYHILGYIKWRLNVITVVCYYLGAAVAFLTKPKTS